MSGEQVHNEHREDEDTVMIVCHCCAVSDRRILELADEGATLLDIGADCGAGFYCGGCIPVIQALIDMRRGVTEDAGRYDAPSATPCASAERRSTACAGMMDACAAIPMS